MQPGAGAGRSFGTCQSFPRLRAAAARGRVVPGGGGGGSTRVVRCAAASLASMRPMPAAPPPPAEVTECCHMLLGGHDCPKARPRLRKRDLRRGLGVPRAPGGQRFASAPALLRARFPSGRPPPTPPPRGRRSPSVFASPPSDEAHSALPQPPHHAASSMRTVLAVKCLRCIYQICVP